MQTEILSVASLKPDPRNARKHDRKNLDVIKESLRQFGQRKNIVVDKDNTVIAGNGLLMAAIELGIKQLSVNRFDLPYKEALAFALADNRSAELSEWDDDNLRETLRELDGLDVDVSGLGFDLRDFGIEDVKKDGLTPEDEIPEDAESICEPGQVWSLGSHRLMCGDSTNPEHIKKLFGKDSAKLCFTSPPYANQREYNGGKELSTEFLAKFIAASESKVKIFAVNLGISRKGGEVQQYWDDYIKAARESGLKLLSWNIWDRSGGGFTVAQATAMFAIEHEWVFVFGKEVVKLNRTVENKCAGDIAGGIRQADGTVTYNEKVINSHRQIGTIFHSMTASGEATEKHPATFPVAFPESYIDACTDKDDFVYDPFIGSGTTLIACEKAHRACLGMEIDQRYCDVIIARWEKFSGEKAKLLAGK